MGKAVACGTAVIGTIALATSAFAQTGGAATSPVNGPGATVAQNSVPPADMHPTPALAATAVPLADPNAAIVLEPKTVVDIEMTDALSSRTNKIGDFFAIRLAAPLIVDGRIVLPAGVSGRGEVTHVARAGWGGKAGEMIVMARYLECGDVKIPLGHFHWGEAGKDRAETALGVGMAVPFAAFLINGGEVAVPSGAHANAQITAEVTIPASVTEQCLHQAS